MISRVADACFWFGRYVERAESTARLLGVTSELVFDAELSPQQCWQPLVIVAGEFPAFSEKHGAGATAQGELVQSYMTWTPQNAVSIATSVRGAREIARTIREVLSRDVWEEVNLLYLWLTEEGTRVYEDRREEFYGQVRRRTQLALGLVRSTMLHDDPMRFLWLGVLLERVGQISRILDMHHHTLTAEERPHEVVEVSLWLALLRACSGFEAFMKRNRGRVSRSAVASFLLFEPQFPRSLRYCLRSALAVMHQIWPGEDRDGGRRSIAALTAMNGWFDGAEPTMRTANAHDFLTAVVDRTSEVCAILQEEMLGPAAVKSSAGTQSQSQ